MKEGILAAMLIIYLYTHIVIVVALLMGGRK